MNSTVLTLRWVRWSFFTQCAQMSSLHVLLSKLSEGTSAQIITDHVLVLFRIKQELSIGKKNVSLDSFFQKIFYIMYLNFMSAHNDELKLCNTSGHIILSIIWAHLQFHFTYFGGTTDFSQCWSHPAFLLVRFECRPLLYLSCASVWALNLAEALSCNVGVFIFLVSPCKTRLFEFVHGVQICDTAQPGHDYFQINK